MTKPWSTKNTVCVQGQSLNLVNPTTPPMNAVCQIYTHIQD